MKIKDFHLIDSLRQRAKIQLYYHKVKFLSYFFDSAFFSESKSAGQPKAAIVPQIQKELHITSPNRLVKRVLDQRLSFQPSLIFFRGLTRKRRFRLFKPSSLFLIYPSLVPLLRAKPDNFDVLALHA